MALPKIDKKTTCCFAGYRPHKYGFKFDESAPEYVELLEKIKKAINAAYKKGYRTFLCGGAIGFDILCAEEVLKLKEVRSRVKLICLLPYEEQAKRFNKLWADKYKNILDKCDYIECVSPEYVPGCYYARTQKMVDYSSMLMTYYDGKSGGTERCIAYSQFAKIKIVNLCEDAPVPEGAFFFLGM